MQIQLVTGGAINERIFRIAKSAYTVTATITAASMSRGAPAIFAVGTIVNGGADGYSIQNADTQGQANNNLLIGVIHDYPDTSSARTGVWQPEDVGLVQCYGVADVYMGIATKTDTLAQGLLLSPNTGSQFRTSLSPIYATGTVASSAVFTGLSGVAGLVVLARSLASQASETFTAKAFVRCM